MVGSDGTDAVDQRRLDGRLEAWLGRTWTKRGFVVLLVAVGLLLVAGALPDPWRWLTVVDGSILAWFALAAMARGELGWPRALARASALYVVPVLVFLVSGGPWQLALAWPYAAVQAWVACPLGLACPLGR